MMTEVREALETLTECELGIQRLDLDLAVALAHESFNDLNMEDMYELQEAFFMANNFDDTMTFEEGKGVLDKAKDKMKNIGAVVKMYYTKIMAFIKKWVAKISVVLLAGEKTRLELAKFVMDKEKQKDFEKRPLSTSWLEALKAKAGINSLEFASMLFSSVLPFEPTKAVAYKEWKEFLKPSTNTYKDDYVVHIIDAGKVSITALDGSKGGVEQIDTSKFNFVNAKKIKDLDIDYIVLSQTLSKSKQTLQKQIDREYKLMKVQESYIGNISSVEGKKATINTIQAYMKSILGIPKEIKFATTLAKAIKNSMDKDIKETEKEG